MTKYRVEPKSRNDIRIFANMLRRHLRLDNVLYVPVVKLLDVLPEIFDTFSYEIVPEEELPEEEGYKPRPAWQVWAARAGLVMFIVVLIYEYLRAFLGWG